MLIDTCGMAATPFAYCAVFRRLRGAGTLLSLLIGGEQRADIFHRALQAAFDFVRDPLQFVMMLFQSREALRHVVGTLLLAAQALLDHRLQSTERTVHAIFGAGCLGHLSPASASLWVARLRLLHRGRIRGALVSAHHLGAQTGEPPQHLVPHPGFCALTEVGGRRHAARHSKKPTANTRRTDEN